MTSLDTLVQRFLDVAAEDGLTTEDGPVTVAHFLDWLALCGYTLVEAPGVATDAYHAHITGRA